MAVVIVAEIVPETQLDRVEQKLDYLASLMGELLKALDDEKEPETASLDGGPAVRERDPGESLG